MNDFDRVEKPIGEQLQRFDKIMQREGGRVSAGLERAMRGTLSIADRAQYDVAVMSRKTVSAVESALASQVQQGIVATSERGKFLVDRTIALTKQLLDADMAEAKAISFELKEIRKLSKDLTGMDREAVGGISRAATQEIKGVSNLSILKSSVLQNIPRLEDFVENILGGGFIGKTAGTFIRLRKEEKQRKINLKAQLATLKAQEAAVDTKDKVDELKDDVSAIRNSLDKSREESEEEKRFRESQLELLERISKSEGKENNTEEQKETKSLFERLTGIVSGIGGAIAAIASKLGITAAVGGAARGLGGLIPLGGKKPPGTPLATGTKFGKLAKFGRFAGRAFLPLAIASAGFSMYNELMDINQSDLTDDEKKKEKQVAVAKFGGTLAGGVGGAKLGAMAGLLGGPLAPLTVPLGALVGGIIGTVAGPKLAEKITRFAQTAFDQIKESFKYVKTLAPYAITFLKDKMFEYVTDFFRNATILWDSLGDYIKKSIYDAIFGKQVSPEQQQRNREENIRNKPPSDKIYGDPGGRIPLSMQVRVIDGFISERDRMVRQDRDAMSSMLAAFSNNINNSVTQVIAPNIRTKNDHNTLERYEMNGAAFA